jgi:hypothetical protein
MKRAEELRSYIKTQSETKKVRGNTLVEDYVVPHPDVE